MTVAWLDPPGSTLTSSSESIDFTVASAPAFISVSFGERRAEELAFRDGAFVHPYRGSSVNGNAYSLRRSGGWPFAPTVHVEERTIVEAPDAVDVPFFVRLSVAPDTPEHRASVAQQATARWNAYPPPGVGEGVDASRFLQGAVWDWTVEAVTLVEVQRRGSGGVAPESGVRYVFDGIEWHEGGLTEVLVEVSVTACYPNRTYERAELGQRLHEWFLLEQKRGMAAPTALQIKHRYTWRDVQSFDVAIVRTDGVHDDLAARPGVKYVAQHIEFTAPEHVYPPYSIPLEAWIRVEPDTLGYRAAAKARVLGFAPGFMNSDDPMKGFPPGKDTINIALGEAPWFVDIDYVVLLQDASMPTSRVPGSGWNYVLMPEDIRFEGRLLDGDQQFRVEAHFTAGTTQEQENEANALFHAWWREHGPAMGEPFPIALLDQVPRPVGVTIVPARFTFTGFDGNAASYDDGMPAAPGVRWVPSNYGGWANAGPLEPGGGTAQENRFYVMAFFDSIEIAMAHWAEANALFSQWFATHPLAPEQGLTLADLAAVPRPDGVNIEPFKFYTLDFTVGDASNTGLDELPANAGFKYVLVEEGWYPLLREEPL